MEAGLIFVGTTDLLSSIVRSIVKQNYNLIGFYYYSNEKGYLQSHVYLIEIFRSLKVDWLGSNLTLDDINEHPLIDFVALKKLKPIRNKNGIDFDSTDIYFQNYKLAIFNALQNHQNINEINAIYNLFGHSCEYNQNDCKDDLYCVNVNWCINTADDLVHLVMKNLNIYDSLSLTEFNNLNPYFGSFNIVTDFTKRFNRLQNSNSNLYMYLGESNYFQELELVDLSRYNKNSNLEILNVLNKSIEDCKVLFTVFLKLLQDDLNFIQTLKSSYNNNQSTINTIYNSTTDLLFTVGNLINEGRRSSRDNLKIELKTKLHSLTKIFKKSLNVDLAELSL